MATTEYEQFCTTEETLLRSTTTFHFDPALTQETLENESRGLSAEPEPTLASGQTYPVPYVENGENLENTGSLDEYDEQDDHYGNTHIYIWFRFYYCVRGIQYFLRAPHTHVLLSA